MNSTAGTPEARDPFRPAARTPRMAVRGGEGSRGASGVTAAGPSAVSP